MRFISEYFKEAQERSKRRKSFWNFILVPFSVIGICLAYFIQFRILWFIHVFVYPEHAGQLNKFWQEGLSFNAFLSSLFLALPISFSSLVLGVIFANLLAWCIPPARKTFDKEAQDIKGVSFLETMGTLKKIALYVVPTCFALGIIGAMTLKSLH